MNGIKRGLVLALIIATILAHSVFALSPADIYLENYLWFDFFLYFALFGLITRDTLSELFKKEGEKESRSGAIGVILGLMLAIGAIGGEIAFGFSLMSFWIVPVILLIAVVINRIRKLFAKEGKEGKKGFSINTILLLILIALVLIFILIPELTFFIPDWMFWSVFSLLTVILVLSFLMTRKEPEDGEGGNWGPKTWDTVKKIWGGGKWLGGKALGGAGKAIAFPFKLGWGVAEGIGKGVAWPFRMAGRGAPWLFGKTTDAWSRWRNKLTVKIIPDKILLNQGEIANFDAFPQNSSRDIVYVWEIKSPWRKDKGITTRTSWNRKSLRINTEFLDITKIREKRTIVVNITDNDTGQAASDKIEITIIKKSGPEITRPGRPEVPPRRREEIPDLEVGETPKEPVPIIITNPKKPFMGLPAIALEGTIRLTAEIPYGYEGEYEKIVWVMQEKETKRQLRIGIGNNIESSTIQGIPPGKHTLIAYPLTSEGEKSKLLLPASVKIKIISLEIPEAPPGEETPAERPQTGKKPAKAPAEEMPEETLREEVPPTEEEIPPSGRKEELLKLKIIKPLNAPLTIARLRLDDENILLEAEIPTALKEFGNTLAVWNIAESNGNNHILAIVRSASTGTITRKEIRYKFASILPRLPENIPEGVHTLAVYPMTEENGRLILSEQLVGDEIRIRILPPKLQEAQPEKGGAPASPAGAPQQPMQQPSRWTKIGLKIPLIKSLFRLKIPNVNVSTGDIKIGGGSKTIIYGRQEPEIVEEKINDNLPPRIVSPNEKQDLTTGKDIIFMAVAGRKYLNMLEPSYALEWSYVEGEKSISQIKSDMENGRFTGLGVSRITKEGAIEAMAARIPNPGTYTVYTIAYPKKGHIFKDLIIDRVVIDVRSEEEEYAEEPEKKESTPPTIISPSEGQDIQTDTEIEFLAAADKIYLNMLNPNNAVRWGYVEGRKNKGQIMAELEKAGTGAGRFTKLGGSRIVNNTLEPVTASIQVPGTYTIYIVLNIKKEYLGYFKDTGLIADTVVIQVMERGGYERIQTEQEIEEEQKSGEYGGEGLAFRPMLDIGGLEIPFEKSPSNKPAAINLNANAEYPIATAVTMIKNGRITEIKNYEIEVLGDSSIVSMRGDVGKLYAKKAGTYEIIFNFTIETPYGPLSRAMALRINAKAQAKEQGKQLEEAA